MGKSCGLLKKGLGVRVFCRGGSGKGGCRGEGFVEGNRLIDAGVSGGGGGGASNRGRMWGMRVG